ncbi:MAG: hypothetical protein DRJ63_04450 [Thermoprotei archaeon]|nr:MAG: hypothetical protein DRJ63_04450 [Thermoprotei archaeon]
MLKVAVYSLTSCQGCLMNIVMALGSAVERLAKLVDVEYFKLVKEIYSDEEIVPVNIAFVEGAAVCEKDIKKLKAIRDNCRILVALGTCASTGGVGYYGSRRAKGFKEPKIARYIEGEPLSSIVYVDYELRGCPVTFSEFMETLSKLIKGIIPRPIDYHVCMECKERGIPCLLDKGIPCLGPITMGGCSAPCPSIGIPCYGCRGPALEADFDNYVNMLREKGVPLQRIIESIEVFMGRKAREWREKYGSMY